MPVLKESFRDRNPVRVGAVSLVVLLVLLGLALNAGPLYLKLTSRSYTALLADAGGLKPMDVVKVNGIKLGVIDSIEVDGDHAAMHFTVQRKGRLGIDTRAVVKTATLLGGKELALEPHGPGELESGAVIPLQRTDPGYDITNALSQLSRTSAALNKPDLKRALDTVSDTLADTPAPLHGALDGLDRLSAVLASRDDELRELLRHARPVTGVLSRRSQDLVTLVGQGDRLVATLNARRQVIEELIKRVNSTIDELNGLVSDNQGQLRPTLEQLHRVVELLERNDKNLAATVQGLNTYAGSLGEAVGGGPWFFAGLQNLAPTNIVPPLPLGANPLVTAPAPAGTGLLPPSAAGVPTGGPR